MPAVRTAPLHRTSSTSSISSTSSKSSSSSLTSPTSSRRRSPRLQRRLTPPVLSGPNKENEPIGPSTTPVPTTPRKKGKGAKGRNGRSPSSGSDSSLSSATGSPLTPSSPSTFKLSPIELEIQLLIVQRAKELTESPLADATEAYVPGAATPSTY